MANVETRMAAPPQLVVFRLHGQRHALPLASVERVIHAVEVTPLPGAPHAVLGAIDIGGGIVPVFCLRRRLRLPAAALTPAEHFIIVRTPRRCLVLVVDEVQEVARSSGAAVAATALAPGLEAMQGVARLDDGLLLIHDLERFLSPAEERSLDAAMGAAA